MTELGVWPAVDLQGGRQVGLVGGDLSQARRYGDPVSFARDRAGEGYQGLHIVDLDGAGRGEPCAIDTVRAIRDVAPDLFLEVGGGIRKVADALSWIGIGIDRVVVGTAAFRETASPSQGEGPTALVSDMVRECLDRLGPERVAVAVDTREGAVLVDAWRQKSLVTLPEAVEGLVLSGVRAVVHTEASRDGSLLGVREEEARTMARAGLEVAAAGGIAGDGDLERLIEAGVRYAIVGRAFHAGRWRPPARIARGVRL